jgi:CO/xanthine dehydrogenase FAD-binding subunit
MSSFRYERPTSVGQATALLAEAPGRARILAGGTDLLVALRAGTARPDLVVDVKRLPGISDLTWTGDGDLVIGAAVQVQRIADDPRVRSTFPALAEGTETIGSIQIRSRATVGGNISNASPCMDSAPALLVLGATLKIAGCAGERELPLREFFVGVKKTVLAPDEIVTSIRVPRSAPGAVNGFDKIKRVYGHDLALVNAAAVYEPAAGTLVAAVGSCGITPMVAGPLGGVDGKSDPDEVGRRLGALALKAICPISDVRASAEYRSDMAAMLCLRLVRRLLAAARRAS